MLDELRLSSHYQIDRIVFCGMTSNNKNNMIFALVFFFYNHTLTGEKEILNEITSSQHECLGIFTFILHSDVLMKISDYNLLVLFM